MRYINDDVLIAGNVFDSIKNIVRNTQGIAIDTGKQNVSINRSGVAVNDTLPEGTYPIQNQSSVINSIIKNPITLVSIGIITYLLLKNRKK